MRFEQAGDNMGVEIFHFAQEEGKKSRAPLMYFTGLIRILIRQKSIFHVEPTL